jgi:corrinoid protein of di/trimethylamine methyltransferase
MNEELFKNLKIAIQEYDADTAETLARQALEEGIDPIATLDVLTAAIREIGDKFASGELFLPELIAAAEAMSRATGPLEEEIQRQGKKKESLGTVLIGTVFGDIHDIGKNMVATMFKASGFQVIDSGVNVKADTFIEAVRERGPDILALSALLTTTAREQKKIIQSLQEKGIRESVKVIVGGGGITRQFADSIGADGYDATASGAIALGKKVLGLKEGV